MRKSRSYAEVYNDLDGDVVNVFRVLRDPVAAARLRELLHLTPYSRKEFFATYAGETSELSDPVERARRTIFRSLAGFGSAASNPDHITGFRGTSRRSGTTPAHDWANYPTFVGEFVERLRAVTIEAVHYERCIEQHDAPDALIYLDPPYVHTTRGMRRRNAAYRFELSDDEHRRMAEIARGVCGMVVVSGYPCPLYDEELFAGWERHERKHMADGARERTEVVWLNPACSAGLRSAVGQVSLLEAVGNG